MTRIQRIINRLLDDIAGFFPYFFGFYLFSLLLSLFFHSWKLFFNWKLFALSVIILGIVSLFSGRVRPLINFVLLKWKEKQLIPWIISHVRIISTLSFSKLESLVLVWIKLWKRLGRRGQIKVGIILVVLIFALVKSIGIVDFIVLAYALISILFVFESRISAVLALILLASCPFFLMFKKDSIAEIMAIYAYYFLVITVITQIAEYMKENKVKKLWS